MRPPLICTIAAMAIAALLASADRLNAQDSTAFQQRGEALLAKNCARCHAIGRTGASPHAEAPPFRTLSKKYPIESLAESLAEGLFTGHPDMPEFTFEAADVGAILDYLTSIQDR
jgi:mono/diheme cytochrome c family protein